MSIVSDSKNLVAICLYKINILSINMYINYFDGFSQSVRQIPDFIKCSSTYVLLFNEWKIKDVTKFSNNLTYLVK